jgi:hypothetical protein
MNKHYQRASMMKASTIVAFNKISTLTKLEVRIPIGV